MATVLVVGGSSAAREEDCLRTCERVQVVPKNGQVHLNITTAPTLLTARRAPVLWMNRNDVLVYGGCSSPGTHLRTAEVLKSNNEQWQSLSVVGEAKECSCATFASTSTGAYIIGGFTDSGCISNVQQFSVEADKITISQKKPFICDLKNATAVHYGDKVLLFGGWDGKRTLATVFEHDTTSEETSMLGMLPYAIECHAAAHVNQLHIGAVRPQFFS